MFKENNKKFEVLDGSIDFKVTGVRGLQTCRHFLSVLSLVDALHRPKARATESHSDSSW